MRRREPAGTVDRFSGPGRKDPLKHFLFQFLSNFRGPAAYVGVLFILILCGLGVPLPEDVPLITGGYLVARKGSVVAMVLVGLLGILLGDSTIFRAGEHYGERLLETRLGRHIPRARVQRTIELFQEHGSKFILLARFVPGLRAVTYFVAGTTGVPFWKFLLFDGIAACVSAPAWVVLGWYAGRQHMLHKAWLWAQRAQVSIALAMGGIVLVWALVGLARKSRPRPLAPKREEPAIPLRAVPGGATEFDGSPTPRRS